MADAFGNEELEIQVLDAQDDLEDVLPKMRYAEGVYLFSQYGAVTKGNITMELESGDTVPQGYAVVCCACSAEDVTTSYEAFEESKVNLNSYVKPLADTMNFVPSVSGPSLPESITAYLTAGYSGATSTKIAEKLITFVLAPTEIPALIES